jgi:hypothetical protein
MPRRRRVANSESSRRRHEGEKPLHVKAIVAAVAVALVASAADTGRGALVPAGQPSCSGQLLEQPFLRWLDPAHYVLAPDGGLEGRARGWTLRGGATVVSGNEPFYVRSRRDSRSLALPSGSSATTPLICVGVEHPTVRLFAMNTGSVLSTLRIDVVFTGPLGLPVAAPVTTLVSGGAWKPTAPALLLANITALPVVTDGAIAVALRFTPQGAAVRWRIDDVYVDPFKGR